MDTDLTAEENLLLLGRLLGCSRRQARRRAGELLTAFGLTGSARDQVARLSGGMRPKLDLAASIIVSAGLLFLDEPTTGLDPRSRSALWEIVRGIVADGTTVLLTTQYLDEADRLADRIAVIDHGRVIAAGTRGELKHSIGSAGIRVRLLDPAQGDRARDLIAADQVVVRDEPDPAVLSVRIPAQPRAGAPGELAARVLGRLTGAGIGVSDFALGQPSLDEVFLALTGSQAATAPPEQAPPEQAPSATAGTEALR